MSTAELNDFYARLIAPLPQQEQLQLASRILAGVAGGTVADENSAEAIQGQRDALAKLRGLIDGGDPDASVRHDEILYGAIVP